MSNLFARIVEKYIQYHAGVFHVVPQCQSLETESLKPITRNQIYAGLKPLDPLAMIAGCDLAWGHVNHGGQRTTKKTNAQNSCSYSKFAMTASESLFLLEAEIGKVNNGKIGRNVTWWQEMDGSYSVITPILPKLWLGTFQATPIRWNQACSSDSIESGTGWLVQTQSKSMQINWYQLFGGSTRNTP